MYVSKRACIKKSRTDDYLDQCDEDVGAGPWSVLENVGLYVCIGRIQGNERTCRQSVPHRKLHSMYSTVQEMCEIEKCGLFLQKRSMEEVNKKAKKVQAKLEMLKLLE